MSRRVIQRVSGFALLALLLAASSLAGCGGKTGAQTSGVPQAGEEASVSANPPQQEDAAPQRAGDAVESGSAKRWDAPPPMQIDPKKKYYAVVKTDKGEFTIELFAAESPKTVNNFVFLAREGFYEGVRFHRIIKTFMIQTGDPNGDGTGGPGYTFEDELPPQHPYEPGIVAMANAGPNTNGSQFFICTGEECRNLDQMPNYTQFGRVTDGMDVVQKIADTPVQPSPYGEMSSPVEDVRILSITIDER